MTPDLRHWLNSLACPGKPDEFETKTLLAGFGIGCPESIRLEPGQPFTPERLTPPLALKVCSPRILHKTEQGGVLFAASAEQAAARARKLQTKFPGERLLVETLVPAVQPEMIVGAVRDAALGPAIMLGAGGILTELYRDVSFRLAPLTRDDARQMIEDLALAPVFSGFRGLPHSANGLMDILVATARLVAELGERFAQLDINPLACDESGRWFALDGVLVLRDP